MGSKTLGPLLTKDPNLVEKVLFPRAKVGCAIGQVGANPTSSPAPCIILLHLWGGGWKCIEILYTIFFFASSSCCDLVLCFFEGGGGENDPLVRSQRSSFSLLEPNWKFVPRKYVVTLYPLWLGVVNRNPSIPKERFNLWLELDLTPIGFV